MVISRCAVGSRRHGIGSKQAGSWGVGGGGGVMAPFEKSRRLCALCEGRMIIHWMWCDTLDTIDALDT